MKLSRLEWVLICFILILLLARYVYPSIAQERTLIDFDVFYYSTKHVLSGGHELYTKAHSLSGGEAKYAPFWTLTFTPFALLPHGASSVIWLAFISFLYVLMFYLSSLILKSYRMSVGGLTYLLVLAFLWKPLMAEMFTGQASTLLSCAILLAILSYIRGKRMWSAALLSYAISIKLPALIFLGFFAFKRDFKSIGNVLGFFLITNIVAAYLFYPAHPFRLLSDWLHILYSSGHGLLFSYDIHSMFAAVGTYFGKNSQFGLNILDLSPLAIKAVTVLIGAVMFLPIFFFSSKSRNDETLVLSLLWILMVLFNPTCWQQNYISFVFPLFFAFTLMSKAKWNCGLYATGCLALMMCLNLLVHSHLLELLHIHQLFGKSRFQDVIKLWPVIGLLLYLFLFSSYTHMNRQKEN